MSGYSDLAGLVIFRPLQSRPAREAYRVSPFKASWSSTVRLLADELRLHGAERAVLELDVRERDIRLDGMPRADARAASSTVVLSFTATMVPGEPQLRYEVGTYYDWRDNVRAIALGLRALRAVDRYGVTKRGEQYAGWKQLLAGSVGEGNPERGRRLVEDAGGEIATALFAAHPDHGGEADDFRDVIAYRDQLRAREQVAA